MLNLLPDGSSWSSVQHRSWISYHLVGSVCSLIHCRDRCCLTPVISIQLVMVMNSSSSGPRLHGVCSTYSGLSLDESWTSLYQRYENWLWTHHLGLTVPHQTNQCHLFCLLLVWIDLVSLLTLVSAVKHLQPLVSHFESDQPFPVE